MSDKRPQPVTRSHRVKLPSEVRSPFEVYRNGVRQTLGRDYRVSSGDLVFTEEVVREKLGMRAWIIGAIGIGTYRRHDDVDVRYEAGGRPMVAQKLELVSDQRRR